MRFAIAIALLAGCADRQHLYYKTGQSVQAAFAKQAEPREGAAPRGLDAEDADIVLTNYRSASTRKGPSGMPGAAPTVAMPGAADFGGAPLEPAGGPPPGGIQLQAK